MKWVRSWFRYTFGSIMVIAGLYGTAALCLSLFTLIGWVTPGQPMFHELDAPTAMDALLFAARCILAAAVAGYLYQRLENKPVS